MLGGDRVAFGRSCTYDSTQPLVIDPTLSYATYIGGNSDEYGLGVAVDRVGQCLCHRPDRIDHFPDHDRSFQHDEQRRLGRVRHQTGAADGKTVLYSTFLGGSGNDYGYGIAVDGSGNAYISGATTSANFPITAGAPDTSKGSRRRGGLRHQAQRRR